VSLNINKHYKQTTL